MTDEFIQPLLAWYDENKRILPWRDKKLYDDKKVQLVSGVTLLIFGILTGLDMVIKSYVYDIIYLAAVIVIFIIMVVVIRKKCKK